MPAWGLLTQRSFRGLNNSLQRDSCVQYDQGITNDSCFIDRVLSSLQEFMGSNRLAFIYHRLTVPNSGAVSFASELNRFVIGSMNDSALQA